MKRPWTAVLCFFLTLVLVGCATTPTSLAARPPPDELQRRVIAWLGMPRTFLVKYWGLAQKTDDRGAGLRYLQYRSRTKKKDACNVVFTVDITGTVRGGRWTGDREACLGFVKELPTQQIRQSLVAF